MSDDKPKPVDDLKEGLGLLFRAAKGAVERFPTDKLEDVAKDAAKEVSRAFESIGSEIDRAFGKPGSRPPAHGQPGHDPSAAHPPPDPNAGGQNAPPAEAKQGERRDEGARREPGEPPKEPPRYDDGYAPEPPKGPRIG